MDSVYTFISYDVRSITNPVAESRHDAARKVTRFMRLVSSHVRMMLVFMRRCISDEAWRDRYIYVHDLPRPHICFRTWPGWLLKSPLRQHLMVIALSHADVEIGMRNWAADHGAEVLRESH